MVKIVKGGHFFVHSHYTFSLNQENFAESKALIELLRGLGKIVFHLSLNWLQLQPMCLVPFRLKVEVWRFWSISK